MRTIKEALEDEIDYADMTEEEYKKEIERLNKENKILRENAEHNDKVVDKVNWENKRLSNIISEFDKWLDEESEKTILSTGHLTCLMMCKNKLQELKGDNK